MTSPKAQAAGAVLFGIALSVGACGQPTIAAPEAPTVLEGDQALISGAREISDLLGGCESPADIQHESRVVSLNDVSIVLITCHDTPTAYTERLFALKSGQAPRLLALPDYDGRGWYAAYEVGMAELDAGGGVLTTLRSDGPNDVCGSEARYLWNGEGFSVEEMSWRGCDSPNTSGPPYPLIWPPQIVSTVDPEASTPAP